jgi:putative oxygen-independent coproporphyrinogen III oxidase
MPPAGLYFHIPFCKRKCPYCDFYSITGREHMAAFVAALQREIALRSAPEMAVNTVYFGGGTPSLLPPDAVGDLLATVKTRFNLLTNAEVTLEANPGAIGRDALKRLREIGVNRLNIGVQSFQDDALRFLGRIHNRADADVVIDQARSAGFDNLGLDLIYGLPGQTLSGWVADLEQALVVRPEHLSCYILTFEPGTPMTRDLDRGRLTPPKESRVVEMFETTASFLTRNGYNHYEISNFARTPDFRSRHNMKYWHFEPYLGFGPSAHSYRNRTRSWNLADLALYLQRLAQDRRPEGGREVLSGEQQVLEALLLGLRLKDGFSIADFEQHFHLSVKATFGRLINQLTEEGCLADRPGRCALTMKGMRYHNSISARFAAEL